MRKKVNESQQARHQNYQLRLVFTGPFISQSTGTMALGMDAEMQKYHGIPVINGSLIKGNIKHALTEFNTHIDKKSPNIPIDRWLGSETSDNQYKPNRANVEFDFYWALDTTEQKTQQEKTYQERTRITIDDKTGTVKEGALQVIEDCFSSGSKPAFIGKISAYFPNENDQKKFEQWIDKALQFIPAMGSFKGTGFGRLNDYSFERKHQNEEIQNPAIALDQTADQFGIKLTIDRPFCLGRPTTNDSNFIVSEEIITGNILKGILAKLMAQKNKKQGATLSKILQEELCFDDLIISHAIPCHKNNKPERISPLPLSYVHQGNTLIDLAHPDSLEEVKNNNWKTVIIFSPDWKDKDREKINNSLKRPANTPNRILSLRTGIEQGVGISLDNQLFSLECIDPKDYIWCADIDLKNIDKDKRSKVINSLEELLSTGLKGIGKTKAQATITVHEIPFRPSIKGKELKAGRQIITLTTEARLLPPDLKLQGTNSAKQLKEAYQNYWHDLDEDFNLETYYAQQTLKGIYYYLKQQHENPETYYPEWLSNAGSVFILNITSEDALNKLAHYTRTGLPAHKEANNSPATWKTTPYLPEHGFGEIQINAPTQASTPIHKKTEKIDLPTEEEAS